VAAVFAVPGRHMGTVAVHSDRFDQIGLGIVVGVDHIGARTGMVGGFPVAGRVTVSGMADGIGFRLWSNYGILMSAVAHVSIVIMPGVLGRGRRV
jgi:hypothetical protein